MHLESEECHSMEILLVGDIVCLQIDEFGNEHIINYIAKSEIIAGNILFGTSPKYPLNFLARSNIMLLQINKNFMLKIFVQKPQILRQFLTIISDRAIGLGSKMKLAKRVPMRSNIMEYLHKQSLLQNSRIITLPISKAELANRLGVLRTSISREFSNMAKEGLIKIHDNKTIEILK